MFRLDVDRMRVLFTLEDRDLAIALAELEGFELVTEDRFRGKRPAPPFFGPRTASRGDGLCEPTQDRPGVWSYRLVYQRRARSA